MKTGADNFQIIGDAQVFYWGCLNPTHQTIHFDRNSSSPPSPVDSFSDIYNNNCKNYIFLEFFLKFVQIIIIF